MGRTLSADVSTVWARHTLGCIADSVSEVAGTITRTDGGTCHKCRSSQHTREMRWHALAVSLFITRKPLTLADGTRVAMADYRATMGAASFTCPLCDTLTPVAKGEADRAVPGREGGRYDARNVVMACHACNLTREHTTDYDVAAYRSAVLKSSDHVIRTRGVVRGPSNFDADMRALVRGTFGDKRVAFEAATVALINGPFAIAD